jgi:heme a synthase
MSHRWYLRLAILATLLALGVIVLGAYVRLSAAGLGCPDWPGCYGHVSVPDTHQAITYADAQYANRPVEPARAWKEMIHRYFAGTLATLILVLAIAAWWRRRETGRRVLLPSLLLLTVIFQALLGMWTVTLLLFPPVVMGHLLGGFTTFALLLLLVLQTGGWLRSGADATNFMRWLAVAGLIVLICQIALGGWTSSNYAAIACPDFPTCQAQWWPAGMDFRDAFAWHGVGPDYQGGILTQAARMAIHVTHRVGALITLFTLLSTSLVFMLKGRSRALKWLGALVGILVLAQAGIGISMVKLGLPLPLADAHNGVAALLLGSVVALVWSAWSGRAPRDR